MQSRRRAARIELLVAANGIRCWQGFNFDSSTPERRGVRDEAVALASGLWKAGCSAELHIWADGFHGFQTIVPTAAVSQTAVQTRQSWVRRVLTP
jgi:hypothetical protein